MLSQQKNKFILIRPAHPPKKHFTHKGTGFTHEGMYSSHHFYLAEASDKVYKQV